MNNVYISGNLRYEPILKTGKSGKVFLPFVLAVYDGKLRDPIWAKCVCFGGTAEYLAQNARKGSEIVVGGSLANVYVDRDNLEVKEFKILATSVRISVKPAGKPYPISQPANHADWEKRAAAEPQPNFN